MLCALYLTLIGNEAHRPKSTRSSEVGPANRSKRIEKGIKSRPKLKRGQTPDDEWFSTESTLSESETKTVSTPSHHEESDSTCKTQWGNLFSKKVF